MIVFPFHVPWLFQYHNVSVEFILHRLQSENCRNAYHRNIAYTVAYAEKGVKSGRITVPRVKILSGNINNLTEN